MSCSTALITGATSEIGLELARKFAQEGHAILFVGPKPAELETQADEIRREFGVEVSVIANGLRDEKAAREIYREASAAGSPIEVLVNQVGSAEAPGLHNAGAVIGLTRLVSLPMLLRGRGCIMNVQATPKASSARSAAMEKVVRAFVVALSRAFAAELGSSGITVTPLCPARGGYAAPALAAC